MANVANIVKTDGYHVARYFKFNSALLLPIPENVEVKLHSKIEKEIFNNR